MFFLLVVTVIIFLLGCVVWWKQPCFRLTKNNSDQNFPLEGWAKQPKPTNFQPTASLFLSGRNKLQNFPKARQKVGWPAANDMICPQKVVCRMPATAKTRSQLRSTPSSFTHLRVTVVHGQSKISLVALHLYCVFFTKIPNNGSWALIEKSWEDWPGVAGMKTLDGLKWKSSWSTLKEKPEPWSLIIPSSVSDRSWKKYHTLNRRHNFVH